MVLKMKRNLFPIIFSILIFFSYFAIPAMAEGDKPKVVVLANSIDYSLAPDFFVFLQNKGMEVSRITATDFDEYRDEKFIVVLGGPDAPEGVGEIVQEYLTQPEQNHLRLKGNRYMFVKTLDRGQKLFIIAGSDREQTQRAHEEYRDSVGQNVVMVEGIKPLANCTTPTGEASMGTIFTLKAGELTSPFSYWGFERSGGYITIRIQSEFGGTFIGKRVISTNQTINQTNETTNETYEINITVDTYDTYEYQAGKGDLTKYTFEEFPERIRFGGVQYDVICADNTKLIVKLIS